MNNNDHEKMAKMFRSYPLRFLMAAALFFVCFIANAQEAKSDQYIEAKTIPLQRVLKTTLDWHVTAYNIKEGEGITFVTSNTPAKICFWNDIGKKEESCFKAGEGLSAFPQVHCGKIVTTRSIANVKNQIVRLR